MTLLPTDADYAYLLELRTGLRRFLHWSEQQAKDAGLTPAQHQLLLAIRGHRGSTAPRSGMSRTSFCCATTARSSSLIEPRRQH